MVQKQKQTNYDVLTCCCELGNETSSSIKVDMFLGHPNGC